jgi:hypothetical protein
MPGRITVDAIRRRIFMQSASAVLLAFGFADSSGFLGHLFCARGIISNPSLAWMDNGAPASFGQCDFSSPIGDGE